jgi:hypothetical protein
MKRGILIFAHNSRDVDYALMSLVSAKFAKTNLQVPVSLIVDKFTVEWMQTSNIYNLSQEIFDKIIEIEKPVTQNTRVLHDGYTSKNVPFVNSNRASVWDLTPYDRTLLIDSDFLILSNRLNEYWNVDSSVMLSPSMQDVRGDRKGILDSWVSETGIPLYWATTVMFTKNNESKIFFDLVDVIRTNYNYFADLFRFNPKQYRNDISFSIAKHMLNGFENRGEDLPPILTLLDKDLIHSIDKNQLRVYLNDSMSEDHVVIASIKDSDVHVMNKQSIIRNAKEFLEVL